MKLEHFFLLAISTFILAVAIQTFYHENVHKAICEFYGGNATITYLDDIWNGQIGLTKCNTSRNWDEITYMNSLTEIIGYHSSAIMNIIVIIVFIVIYFWKFDNEKEFRLR